MINSHFKFFLFAIVASCVTSPSLSAPVESISLETFNDGPQPFWEVSVNCEASSKIRLMRRPVDGVQWCSSEVTTLCDKNKFSLSRQLCGDNYTEHVTIAPVAKRQNAKPLGDIPPAPIANQAAGTVDTKTNAKPPISLPEQPLASDGPSSRIANRKNLRKEQMQIEEQRILIEQKRLELRRNELDLRRQQLNAN